METRQDLRVGNRHDGGLRTREGFVSLVKTARESIRNWGKILICGNGGSAAQADHFAAELIGDGLPCISLTNPAVITALANDYVYEEVFSKQVEALGEKHDLLICLTTSGLSRNISMAAFTAHRAGMKVFTITGFDAPKWDYSEYVRLPYGDTQVIQEKTLLVLHGLWKELI